MKKYFYNDGITSFKQQIISISLNSPKQQRTASLKESLKSIPGKTFQTILFFAALSRQLGRNMPEDVHDPV